MSFISKNPQRSVHPDVNPSARRIISEQLPIGTEIVGYYKHKFVDDRYKKENYVVMDKETGEDILIYHCTSLEREFAFYDIGQLLKLVYKGKIENKNGPYRGKLAHIWDVLVDESFVPTPNFVAQLQNDVMSRRSAVMGTNQISAPSPAVFVQPQNKPNKQHNPFG